LKRKREKGDNSKKGKNKKRKVEEMNQGLGEVDEDIEDNEDEHIVFTLNRPPVFSFDRSESLNGSSDIVFDESKLGQFFNFEESDVSNSSEFNPRLIYYDWLGDSAMTSHVSNRRDAFKTFHPLTDTTVSGVGNVKTEAKGRGTVELKSSYKGQSYILELKDVLYIPTN
jgi:hypothetical protein